MPLLVTGTFQKQIKLLAQLNLNIKKDKPLYISCRFIIAEAFPNEKEEKQ